MELLIRHNNAKNDDNFHKCFNLPILNSLNKSGTRFSVLGDPDRVVVDLLPPASTPPLSIYYDIKSHDILETK